MAGLEPWRSEVVQELGVEPESAVEAVEASASAWDGFSRTKGKGLSMGWLYSIGTRGRRRFGSSSGGSEQRRLSVKK